MNTTRRKVYKRREEPEIQYRSDHSQLSSEQNQPQSCQLQIKQQQCGWDQDYEQQEQPDSEPKITQTHSYNFNQKLEQVQQNNYQRKTLKTIIAEEMINNNKIDCRMIKKQLKAKQLSIPLYSDKYKSIVQSVATDIIRGIERYLIVECYMQVKQLNRNGIELIIRKIIRYQEFFDEETAAMLRHFIRYLYDFEEFEEAEVNKDIVHHLYQKIVGLTSELGCQISKPNIFQKVRDKWRRRRNKAKSIKLQDAGEDGFTNMEDVNKQWNEQHQMFLIKCYKQNQDFNMIRNYFWEEYPQKKRLWTADSLKNRFQKTMRRGYYCLKQIIESERNLKKKVNLPELIRMDQRMIKLLISKIYPTELRLKFIELLEGNRDKGLVQWLILSINSELGQKKFFYALNLARKKGSHKTH